MRSGEDIMSEQNGRCATSLAGVRVLLVDDDAAVRALLTTLLETYGATVTSVGSAAGALRVLPVERPDVLVTDLTMPEEDGFALIRQVRALSPEQGGRTPAALVTGLAAALDRAKVLRAGFQFCLAKPVNAGELVASVAILATKA
jgi:CheY-like chemotaxis protein